MSFLIFLAVLGILIIVHEFGHFIAARRTGVKVEKFSLGFGRQVLKKKIGDTEYSISLIPFGGYVKLAGDSREEYKGSKNEYLGRSPFERAKIVLFGPLFNYILGFLCFWAVFSAGYPVLTTKVGGLIDGFGAKESGILAGDKIIAIDGEKVENWEELQKSIQPKQPGSSIAVLILRDNQEQKIDVKVKERESPDPFSKKRKVGAIGIMPKDEIIKVRHNIAEAFILSIERTWQLTVMTYKAFWYMAAGRISLRQSVTGPIGMFYITSQAASYGIIPLLNLIALISINLAILNLMPFPVLDGGHIALLALEKIRGKALGIKVERILTQAGMAMIITLALAVTYNDVLNFFGDKISKLFIK